VTLQSPHTIRNFIFSGRFVLIAFFSAMGVAVVLVIGSIIINAVKNEGLIPPPNTLDVYECTGSLTPFSFYYLHGTERVKIKSAAGILEGTVHQNRFDWASFSGDSTMLGFLPPTEITFEDAKTLRITGPGYPEVRCAIATAHSSHRREIVQ
jgi:hypothetical protein